MLAVVDDNNYKKMVVRDGNYTRDGRRRGSYKCKLSCQASNGSWDDTVTQTRDTNRAL